jgi:molybdate/tungstate transport system substrate-binding protein
LILRRISICLCVLLLSSAAASADTANVLYAGSLVNLMEHVIGPAFDRAGGDRFQGFAGGSNALANQIKGRLRRGDVFISANPRINDDLMGAGNGDWVTWYVTFARSPLVIGYSPSSRFAAELKTKPWYEVLQQPGIRIGRTDPKLDPKGALTVRLLERAGELYKQPDLAAKVLGPPDNPGQVLPEENLVGRLQSGQIDVGFFYSTETSDLKIPAISLPPDLELGAVYTVTVLRDAASPAAAARFVEYLLGPQGRSIMHDHGLATVEPTISGNADQVPAPIRAEIAAAK